MALGQQQYAFLVSPGERIDIAVGDDAARVILYELCGLGYVDLLPHLQILHLGRRRRVGVAAPEGVFPVVIADVGGIEEKVTVRLELFLLFKGHSRLVALTAVVGGNGLRFALFVGNDGGKHERAELGGDLDAEQALLAFRITGKLGAGHLKTGIAGRDLLNDLVLQLALFRFLVVDLEILERVVHINVALAVGADVDIDEPSHAAAYGKLVLLVEHEPGAAALRLVPCARLLAAHVLIRYLYPERSVDREPRRIVAEYALGPARILHRQLPRKLEVRSLVGITRALFGENVLHPGIVKRPVLAVDQIVAHLVVVIDPQDRSNGIAALKRNLPLLKINNGRVVKEAGVQCQIYRRRRRYRIEFKFCRGICPQRLVPCNRRIIVLNSLAECH